MDGARDAKRRVWDHGGKIQFGCGKLDAEV